MPETQVVAFDQLLDSCRRNLEYQPTFDLSTREPVPPLTVGRRLARTLLEPSTLRLWFRPGPALVGSIDAGDRQLHGHAGERIIGRGSRESGSG
jgi:hypothetical protein